MMNKRNIVISLTTIPSRVDTSLFFALENLKKMNADKIYIHVPKWSKREQKSYNFNNIKNYISSKDNIIINNIDEDYGPITKLIPLLDLEKDPNLLILLVDDDCVHHTSAIDHLLNYKHLPAYGYTSRIPVFSSTKKNYIDNLQLIKYVQNEYIVPFIETSGLAVYKRSCFPETSKEFIEWTNTLPKDCFYVDDMVIGAWLSKNNIYSWIIPCSPNHFWYHNYASNSLSITAGNFEWRNIFVFNELYKLNYFQTYFHSYKNNKLLLQNGKKKYQWTSKELIIFYIMTIIIIITFILFVTSVFSYYNYYK